MDKNPFGKEEWETDITRFLMLCSKEDAKFLSLPKHKRKPEDYVRLMVITLTFGFRCAFMRILGEAECCQADIFGGFGAVMQDYARISGWIEDFIAAIPQDDLREIVREEWEKVRATLDADNFHFKQLLK